MTDNITQNTSSAQDDTAQDIETLEKIRDSLLQENEDLDRELVQVKDDLERETAEDRAIIDQAAAEIDGLQDKANTEENQGQISNVQSSIDEM